MMRIHLQLVLSVCVVCYELMSVQTHNQVIDKVVIKNVDDESEIRGNFQNLFNSIAKNDAMKSEIYQGVLKQKIAKERQAFDEVKEELQIARNKNVYKMINFYKKSNTNENIKVAKRKTNKNNRNTEIEFKDYDDISAETLQKCDPKIQKCLKVFKKINTQLKEENTQLKNDKKQLKKQMEYTAFQCAMSAMQRSVKFFYEEVVQKVEEVKRFKPSVDTGNIHPIISRLAPPSEQNTSQREYLEYKEFLRVLPNYTETPEFFQVQEEQLPQIEVAQYLDTFLTTKKLQDGFAATVPSVYYMCNYYRTLSESEGLQRFEKNHSIPSLSIALAADDGWSFNEVDLTYMNILRSAVNDSKIESVKVRDGPVFNDVLLPLADPKNGC